jgi:hypothetical protein
MWLIGWPVWKQLRFVYYLKTREVEFSHGPDLDTLREIGEVLQTSPYIVCCVKLNNKEFYEWNVNNDGSLCKYNIWSNKKWFNRQSVILSRRGEKNLLGRTYRYNIRFISTRFFVAWAVKRYTQEQFVMAKMGGFKEYWRLKSS